MDQVEKQRRRNRIISLAAIALIAVVAVTVVVYSFSLFRGTAVPLPAYLDRCVSGSLFYHAHPQVTINVNGTSFIIPANMGFSGCARVIHTPEPGLHARRLLPDMGKLCEQRPNSHLQLYTDLRQPRCPRAQSNNDGGRDS